MRREDDVGQAGQRRGEALAVGVRLAGEDVDGRATQAAVGQALAEGVDVDHRTPGEVDEDRPPLHLGDAVLPEEPLVGRSAVHVDRDDVRCGQELAQAAHAGGVADRQALGDVVEDHVHAERLGQDRQLRPDRPVADDAQRLAPDLVRPLGGLGPHARLQGGVLLRKTPGQGDGLGDRELHDRPRVGVGGVEDSDPQARSRRQVDLVGADAVRSDRGQMGAGLQDLACQARLRADPEDVHAP